MQYLGGKAKLGRRIAHAINAIREPGQPYWEPFCGSCWVTMHIRGAPRFASDGCPELIAMWQALQAGWEPPTVVSETMYYDAKGGKYPPHVRGFIGFGCSFGGKWFAGYARGNVRNYALSAQRSILLQARRLSDVSFFCADYAAPEPGAGLFIYADPPYAGTEGYGGAAFPFDTEEFWQTARTWVDRGHVVLVSEYRAPHDYSCVCEFPTTTEIRTADNGREPRTERLFMHVTQAHLFHERVTVQAPLFADVAVEAMT